MTFDIDPLKTDPFTVFDQWMKEAEKQEPNNPNAMCLSTVSKDGKPSSRMVLLKDYDVNGFTFFSNSQSRKGLELKDNPWVALCLYWKTFQRQVRIEGKAEKVERHITEAYFHGRSRGSQIASHCSDQSQILQDKKIYLDRIAKAEKHFKDVEVIPCKDEWNGYRVVPTMIELWQEGEFRTHDRYAFKKDGNGQWVGQRLYP